MAIRYRDGNATVELTGDLERVALEAVDRILPGVRAQLEAEARDVYATARGEWPEKTGRSRGGLQLVTEVTEESISVKIENAVPYAVYVRPRAWFGTTTAWQLLVRSPMRAAAKAIAKSVGSVVVAALARRG